MANRLIRPIRIDGNLAYVPLTKGYEAIIDASDVALVSQWLWYAQISKRTVYAIADNFDENGRRQTLRMHRLVTAPPADMQIDHINGDGLDNRRANLRVVTLAENSRNQRLAKNSTSGFKGVTWHKCKSKWIARIVLNRKTIHLGYFSTPEAAYEAYSKASIELHGQYGRLA
jgi:hypothetical protein